jgi:hypothetical protein
LTRRAGWETVGKLQQEKFAMLTWRSACIALAIVAGIVDASAQSTRPPRPRVEIYPGRLWHRECVDGLQVSHKYVGRTVLMPWMRCWWVRG